MENKTIENIKVFMKKKGLKQYQAASMLGINKFTLNRWLTGKGKPGRAYERLIETLIREAI